MPHNTKYEGDVSKMFKLLNKKKNNKGFTLVELVIAIAILAILVGLLAPQYTKYVEKSRKTADASNMDEIVKVIKVFAADPDNDLPANTYTVTISDTSSTKATVSNITTELKTELDSAIPKWESTTTKSKKWNGGSSAPIIAEVTVNKDGGTSVEYKPDDFKNYMASKTTNSTTGK